MRTAKVKKKKKTHKEQIKGLCMYLDSLSVSFLTSKDLRILEKPNFSNIEDIGETYAEKAPRNKIDLAVYCATVLNTRFPHPRSNDKYCIENNHKSPLDAIWDAFSEKNPFSIWYANRGGGKTFDLAILSWLESVFKPKCWTTILGGSLEQSTKSVSYLGDLWDLHAVRNIRDKLLVNKQVAGRGFKTTHGSLVQALAASTKSVRGPHPQKLRLDEVDEMEEKIYYGALGQPKSNFGILDNVIVSSTLHNPFGLMSEIIDSRNEIGAAFYAWCIREVLEPRGFWTKEEFENKIKAITKAMADAEYYLKRPKIGETIFDFDSVDRAYRRGINDKFEPKVYTEAGIDWGYACTILNIIQDPREIFRNTNSYSFEYIELKERCEKITRICIEKKIERIYADSNPKDSNITLKKTLIENRCSTEVVPIAFNKWKGIGINVLRFLLERNKLNITDKTCQDKMKKYHYKDADLGTIDKKDDHYPDSLIAWATSRYKILGI
jgi:hypothetical protein